MPLICGAFVWQLAMLIHKPLEFELKLKLYFVVIAFLVNIISILFFSDFGVLFAAYSTLISAILYLMLNVFGS
jgi:hypothetical protein